MESILKRLHLISVLFCYFLFFLVINFTQLARSERVNNNIGPNNNTKVSFLDRNWEVQAGSPDKIFDKKMSICLTKL
jgi:hypothetical protein